MRFDVAGTEKELALDAPSGVIIYCFMERCPDEGSLAAHATPARDSVCGTVNRIAIGSRTSSGMVILDLLAVPNQILSPRTKRN